MPFLTKPPMVPGVLSSTEQPTLAMGSMVLRPWVEADVPALVAAYQEPEIQFWHLRSMTTEEAAATVATAASAWSNESGAHWAVEDRGVLTGRMTLKIHFGCADASYWILPAARGRGAAPRALTMAVDWAFRAGLQRVELQHSTRNQASCRVAAKAGFADEGTRRSAVLHPDGWHDMHVHGRIRDQSSRPLIEPDVG